MFGVSIIVKCRYLETRYISFTNMSALFHLLCALGITNPVLFTSLNSVTGDGYQFLSERHFLVCVSDCICALDVCGITCAGMSLTHKCFVTGDGEERVKDQSSDVVKQQQHVQRSKERLEERWRTQ